MLPLVICLMHVMHKDTRKYTRLVPSRNITLFFRLRITFASYHPNNCHDRTSNCNVIYRTPPCVEATPPFHDSDTTFGSSVNANDKQTWIANRIAYQCDPS
jgi:hypothetical protein